MRIFSQRRCVAKSHPKQTEISGSGTDQLAFPNTRQRTKSKKHKS
jgi:hypothetical protein